MDASSAVVAGVNSDGLSMTRLPAASAVASGDERERDRIVPGRDDADHAERLIDDAVLAGEEDHRHAPPLGTHPARADCGADS